MSAIHLEANRVEAQRELWVRERCPIMPGDDAGSGLSTTPLKRAKMEAPNQSESSSRRRSI